MFYLPLIMCNHKVVSNKKWKMDQTFVTFSEDLNFNKIFLPSKADNCAEKMLIILKYHRVEKIIMRI